MGRLGDDVVCLWRHRDRTWSVVWVVWTERDVMCGCGVLYLVSMWHLLWKSWEVLCDGRVVGHDRE